jgi:lipopolysaccharide transport system ATP-binding protein
MINPAIRIEGLGKRYRLGETHEHTLSHRLSSAVGRIVGRRNAGPQGSPEDFWALSDVTLDINEGESVGIIGGNGAGKSTLLKILSRITSPTTGRAVVRGRLASLLEVGTGFHPELTGRENIFLNGTILGMRKAEVVRKFDEIVSFAGVEKFINTPVKRYSSGMYVRLAFAVAAHLEPDVLIVDEVLAVGDLDFQKKCLRRMESAAREGRTVLFVSHNLAAIQAITTRCVELQHGRVVFEGESRAAVQRYMHREVDDQGVYNLADQVRAHSGLSREVELIDGRLTSVKTGSEGTVLSFTIRLKKRAEVSALRLGITVLRADHLQVGALFSEYFSFKAGQDDVTIRVETGALNLGSGSYSLSMSVGKGDTASGHRAYDAVTNVFDFNVERETTAGGTMIGWNPGWGACDFGLATICNAR